MKGDNLWEIVLLAGAGTVLISYIFMMFSTGRIFECMVPFAGLLYISSKLFKMSAQEKEDNKKQGE